MINASMIAVALGRMSKDEKRSLLRQTYAKLSPNERYDLAQVAAGFHDNNPDQPNPFKALGEGR